MIKTTGLRVDLLGAACLLGVSLGAIAAQEEKNPTALQCFIKVPTGLRCLTGLVTPTDRYMQDVSSPTVAAVMGKRN